MCILMLYAILRAPDATRLPRTVITGRMYATVFTLITDALCP